MLGMIPVIGDAIPVLIGSYLIHVARKHKLGKWLEARMAANLLLDWAVGSIPIAGDAFDVAFKANLKNLSLLEKAIENRTPPPKNK
jgi:hypothetical protein